jgi:uracil-DNA glycosylase
VLLRASRPGGGAGEAPASVRGVRDREARGWPPPVHPAWEPELAGAGEALARALEAVAAERAAGHVVLPAPEHALRALATPPDAVRVLLLGQDPYPTPGHAVGLSFAVAPGVRPLPRSLVNVLAELVADTGVPAPTGGDLSPWTDQGVLLLNRVLTVRAGAPGSHRRRGWEEVTAAVVRALARRHRAGAPLVALLWGRDAAAVRPLLGDVPVVLSAHPSPLSASRGFLGSRPFSRADAALAAQGAPPVDWRLP